MHKKLLVIAASAAMLALPAFALADEEHSGFDRSLHCADTVGSPVVNVTEKIKNDADSGIAGNNWALDALERHITVWKTATPGTYCATVRDEGSFQAFAGEKSPGNTGVLTGNERGEIQGGYVATITGSLLQNPAGKTKGRVDAVDYRCDEQGNCPGYVSWMGQYFTAGYGSTMPWWGWIYDGGKFGTWVNAASGNSGDILPAVSGEGHGD